MRKKIKPAAINGFITCFCLWPNRKMFDEQYLAYRFPLFKAITLKSFQEQTDKDFNLILKHTKHLPQKYKDALAVLEQENDFLYNVYIDDPEESFDVNNYAGYVDDVSISFIIDNDDAVPKDYIAKLRPFLQKQFAGNVLSIPQVSNIQRIKPDHYLIQDCYEMVHAVGVAYVAPRGDYKPVSALAGGDHSRMHYDNQVILLRGCGGLRIINGRNIANELDLLDVSTKKYTGAELRKELLVAGYSDFDFKCLAVCPDRRLLQFIIKSVGFVWRRIFARNRQPIFHRTVG